LEAPTRRQRARRLARLASQKATAGIAECHLCCGSARTYNILQLEIAAGTAIPVVHPVEPIDRATRGPVPQGLQGRIDVGT
jgi:hypothetical protein